jgi:hypothetical protein
MQHVVPAVGPHPCVDWLGRTSETQVSLLQLPSIQPLHLRLDQSARVKSDTD